MDRNPFQIFEKPLPGWELDLIRRYRIEGRTQYHVQLIRRVDGATVYDISSSLQTAFGHAKKLAEGVE